MSASLIEKIKEQFGSLKKKLEDYEAAHATDTETSINDSTQEIVVAQKFGEFQLEDGTMIQTDTDNLEKGSAVKVQNDSGEWIAIPDGEYNCMLPDGSMQVIKIEAGIVTDMAPVEPPAQGQTQSNEDPSAKEDYRAEIDALKNEIASIKEALAKLSENNTTLSGENESAKAIVISLTKENEKLRTETVQLSALVKETISIVEVLANSPSTEPVNKPANVSMSKLPKPHTNYLELREAANIR